MRSDCPDSGPASSPLGLAPFLGTGGGISGSAHEPAGGDTSTHSEVVPVSSVLLVGPGGPVPGSTHSDMVPGPDVTVSSVLLVGPALVSGAELGSSFGGLTGSSWSPAGLLSLLFLTVSGERRYHDNQSVNHTAEKSHL